MFDDFELPPYTSAVCSLILLAFLGPILYSIYNRQKADNECFVKASDWTMATELSGMNDTTQVKFFAEKYRTFKLACPRGHVLVNEKIVPAPVKAMAAQLEKQP